MCKLKKLEFHTGRRCKEEFERLIKTENEAAIIVDRILKSYSFDVIILVLAANILTRENMYGANSKIFLWAKKYENHVGFLMELFKFQAPLRLLEEIITIILRRFPN